MKVKISIFLFASFTSLASAQTLINTGGEYCSNNTTEVYFSIGEVFIETSTNTTNAITAGFNQPTINITPTNIRFENVKINVFPNPTSNILRISTNSNTKYCVKISSAAGVSVKSLTFSENESQIDVSDISPGVYVIEISDITGASNSYRIVKQ